MEKQNKPTLLLIEDVISNQKKFIDELQNIADITCVGSEVWAREAFDKNKEFDIIAIDACLTGDEVDTIDLIKYIRSSYTGPMIAISSMDNYNKILVDAGCNHQMEKKYAPAYIANLLKSEIQSSSISKTDDQEKIEHIFQISVEEQLPIIEELLGKLNKVIKLKNNIENDVLWVKIESGLIKLGYSKNPKDTEGLGFHNDLTLKYDNATNSAIMQLVIFDGYNSWGCYNQILCFGATEENDDSGFEFELEGKKYRYLIWTKK